MYEWVNFSKVPHIWAKIGSNLRKFWKNRVILLKIWPKIGPIGIRMSRFFLKNWYLYGSAFKFHGGTSLPKPNLSTPQCQPCTWNQIKIKCVHDLCAPCGTSRMFIFMLRLQYVQVTQGLRVSSLQFTSPLEFNAIFCDGFTLRHELTAGSEIRNPVPAKFKHVTNIVTCTCTMLWLRHVRAGTEISKKLTSNPRLSAKKYTTFLFPQMGHSLQIFV